MNMDFHNVKGVRLCTVRTLYARCKKSIVIPCKSVVIHGIYTDLRELLQHAYSVCTVQKRTPLTPWKSVFMDHFPCDISWPNASKIHKMPFHSKILKKKPLLKKDFDLLASSMTHSSARLVASVATSTSWCPLWDLALDRGIPPVLQPQHTQFSSPEKSAPTVGLKPMFNS